MQNIVIAKPYEFVPPDRGTFWPAVFRPLLRPILARNWGVTSVEIVGIESLRAALRERASVVLVPNHCRPCDPMVVSVLGAEAGTPLYMMASWHLFMGSRFQAWLLRRLGAFSVYREGLDRTAVKTAIELLVEARRPLVIFPEGIITRSNDRLGALNEGPAFIARSAAKHRAKTEPGARTLLIPVALRYRFLGRLEESAAPVLDRIETRLTWTPRPELPLIERLRRVGNAILGLKELELVGEFRQATIPSDWRGWSTTSSGRSKTSGRSRSGKATSLRGCVRSARRSFRNWWTGDSPTPSASGAGTSLPGSTWRSSFRSIRRAISKETPAPSACSKRSSGWKKT